MEKNQKTIGLTILGVLGIYILYSIFTPADDQKIIEEDIDKKANAEVVLDEEENFQLTALLEDGMGLEDVFISTTNDVLEVRIKAPTISGEELYEGLTLVFSFLDEKINPDFNNMRLIFTINNVDASIVEVSRTNVISWKNNEISNAEFIQSFEKKSLL